MQPSPTRVAHRFHSRTASVKVEVIDQATEKAQGKYNSGMAVGRFLSSIPLYRVFDGEEMREIIDTGEIKGGDYSVPGERAFGAQWGADRGEVAQWGEGQRGKRLGHELFMAEVDGKGRVFAHLSGAGGLLKPGAGEVSLDPSFCATSLGCAMHISTRDVVNWYVVENGKPKRTTLTQLKDLSESLGHKPRDIDLFKGEMLYSLPMVLQKALRWEVFRAQTRKLDRMEKIRVQREMGISSGDSMDGDQLGRLILRSMCQGGACEDWGTSSSQAHKQAFPSGADGEDSFSVLVALTAHVAAPHREVSLAGESAKVKYVEVGVPGGRGMGAWRRLWQPWGDAEITFLKGGGIVIR